MFNERTVTCDLCAHLYVSHAEGCPYCGSLAVRPDPTAASGRTATGGAALWRLTSVAALRALVSVAKVRGDVVAGTDPVTDGAPAAQDAS